MRQVVSALDAALSMITVALRHSAEGAGQDVGAAADGAWEVMMARPLPLLVLVVGLPALLLGTTFLQAAAVHIAIRDADDRPASMAEAARFAVARMVPLFGWWLLAGLLVGIASLFLLVPGIYLGVVLFSSLTLVVLVERRGMSRCFSLVKGRFWTTFGRVALLVLIAGTGNLLASLIAEAVAGGAFAADITTVLAALLTIPLGPVITAFMIVTYTELRHHEDRAVTTARLAAELSR